MPVKTAELVIKQYIDEEDYKLIQALQDRCLETDGTSLKLELAYKLNSLKSENAHTLEKTNEFLYYIEDRLVGYIGICDFGGGQIEVNGMVHPDYRRQGIFTKLFKRVLETWKQRGKVDMLLLSDRLSTSGSGFLKKIGAELVFSENEMVLENPKAIGVLNSEMTLLKATNHDAKEIARQNRIYFRDVHEEADEAIDDEPLLMPEDEAKKGIRIYLAQVKGKTIGKIHLEKHSNKGAIYGFGVLPEERRRGYGRQILKLGIKKLFDMGCDSIMLQVVSENKKALELYLGCGFKEVSTMNYYTYGKPKRSLKPLFSTERIAFYKAGEEDIKWIMAMESDPDNRDFIWQGTYDQHLHEIKDESTLLVVMLHRESSKRIGYCLNGLNTQSDVFELRRIAIDQKGQGYGREAMKGILAYCFDSLKMNRFWLDVYPFNAVGIKLYESLGLHLDGVLRQAYKHARGYVDQCVYSMLKEEYEITRKRE